MVVSLGAECISGENRRFPNLQRSFCSSRSHWHMGAIRLASSERSENERLALGKETVPHEDNGKGFFSNDSRLLTEFQIQYAVVKDTPFASNMMNELLEYLKRQIATCKEQHSTFSISENEVSEYGATMTCTRLNETSSLLHDVYTIYTEEGNLEIDYRIDDRCRTNMVRPDSHAILISGSALSEVIREGWHDER